MMYIEEWLFNQENSNSTSILREHSLNLDGPIYSNILSIKIDFSKEFFIPTLCFNQIYSKLVEISLIEDFEKNYNIEVNYPLYNIGLKEVKTSEAIIKATIGAYDRRINRVTVPSKGILYYGGRGILLDALYNIMLITGFMVEYNKENDKFIVKRPVLYIDNRVLINTDILSKYIAKKILPSITNMVGYINKPTVLFQNSGSKIEVSPEFSGHNIAVTIKPLKYLVQTPLTHHPNVGLNEISSYLWNFLYDYKRILQ